MSSVVVVNAVEGPELSTKSSVFALTSSTNSVESFIKWFSSYFMLQQALDEKSQSAKEGLSKAEQPFHIRHKRLISFSIPFVIVQCIWWSYMLTGGNLNLFVGRVGSEQKPRWMVTLTMVFGSMVAGATSEGGAAVAFPILTLVMGVLPSIARDFSFLIQSVGMTAAAFSILYMGIKIEYKSVIYCTIGGVAGVILGLEKVAPRLTPPYSKMYFVCIWFAFAVSLFWLNFYHDRKVFNSVPSWEQGVIFKKVLFRTNWAHCPSIDLVVNWKAIVLLCFGILGGIFSSMSGSGLDICSFAVLALFFRVSERIATPTSVVLMGINTVVAFLYREYQMNEVDPEAYRLWLVCIPVVVVGAPLGAIMSSHFHREVLSWMIYLTDSVQLIGALYVVRPWTTLKTDTPVDLCVTSAVILVAGALFFTFLAFAGQKLLETVNDDNEITDLQLPQFDKEAVELHHEGTEMVLTSHHGRGVVDVEDAVDADDSNNTNLDQELAVRHDKGEFQSVI